MANHHGEPAPQPLGFYRIVNSGYGAFYRNLSLRQVQRLVFFTQSYAQSLKLGGAVEPRLRFIRPAVDVATFSPGKDGSELRKKYVLGAEDKVVLFVGALTRRAGDERRGLSYLIEAMKLVREEVSSARLVVVGGGDLLPRVKRRVQKLSLEQSVLFAGPVFGEELALHYTLCHLFVFPSYYEPFGFVVLEAMASGKPVIVCDIPGVRESVEQGVDGLKVPPRDSRALAQAIVHLLKSEGLAQAMGQKARSKVERRSWRQFAEEMVTVYQEVVKAARPTATRV